MRNNKKLDYTVKMGIRTIHINEANAIIRSYKNIKITGLNNLVPYINRMLDETL